MKIITAPHQTLRTKAKPITKLDQKIKTFLGQLEQTLVAKQDPPGVGLAGNQVNQTWMAFAIRPVEARQETKSVPVQVFINPEIAEHSQEKSLGSNPKEPDLEGCLSVPKIYGPVKRWIWVKLHYQIWDEAQDKLVAKQQKFTNFTARIVQHELDHLNGILFTDHLLNSDYPVFLQEEQQMVELPDKSLLAAY